MPASGGSRPMINSGGINYAVGDDQKICGKYMKNMRSIFGRKERNFSRVNFGDRNFEAKKNWSTTENKTNGMMMQSQGEKVLYFIFRKKTPVFSSFPQLENLFVTILQGRVQNFKQKIRGKFPIEKNKRKCVQSARDKGKMIIITIHFMIIPREESKRA